MGRGAVSDDSDEPGSGDESLFLMISKDPLETDEALPSRVGGKFSSLLVTSRPKEWSVANFKSLVEADVESKHLTVLTGPNSSGKSSFIQSLLVEAQSSPSQVALNGPLVRLGRPADVIREGTRELTLRWAADRRGEGRSAPPTRFEYVVTAKVEDTGALTPTKVQLLVDGEEFITTVPPVNGENVLDEVLQAEIDNEYTKMRGTPLQIETVWGEASADRLTLMMKGLWPTGFFFYDESSDRADRFLKYFGRGNMLKFPRRTGKPQDILGALATLAH